MTTPPQLFETARLRLRPPVPTDAPRMFEAWACDAEVTRYLVWSPHADIGESEAHIARCIEGWRNGSPLVWFIELRETGELIGSLAARDQAHGINLGYLLARRAWGSGYMVEALEPVVTWFLSRPDVHRVWATCDVENTASTRALEKAGFEFEGILRQWDHKPNLGPGRRDARCYSRVRRHG
jgi:RimJ/RimL family protein N-acetyltransferase